jgi:quercetin dioxygenase-like cupin family protein
MNRHYCRALIAIPFIIAGALPLAGLSSTCVAAQAARSTQSSQEGGAETITPLPDLTTTTAGEPLLYLSTPNPVISSDILTVPPGGVTRWMTHPVPVYLYILQGDLTVQFADGRKEQTFHEGQVLLQPRAAWHRGRNEGQRPLRFLAVCIGAKGVPTILHPPATD